MSDTPVQQEMPPMPPQKSSGGAGCWVSVLLTLFVAGVLVLVGLFLPPVDLWNRLFGANYVKLTADANAIQADGLTVAVNPNEISSLDVLLETIPAGEFLSSRQANLLDTPPAHLALQSPVYLMDTRGPLPNTITLDVEIPNVAASPDVLSLYHWSEDNPTWRFVPSQRKGENTLTTTLDFVPEQLALFQVAPPLQPTILTAVDLVQTLSPQVGELSTIVSPAGLQPTLEGTLTGSLAAGFDLNAGYLVMPLIRNFADPQALDPNTVETILSNRALRDQHIAHIATFANTGFAGVMIDYRDIDPAQRDAFTAFIRSLAERLQANGLALGVVVPGAENIAGTWETGAYDWRALGEVANLVQVNLHRSPQLYLPGEDQVVEAMLRWAVGEIDRHKILVGLSARSVREVAGAFTPVGYAEGLSGLGNVIVEADVSHRGTIGPGTKIEAHLDGFRAISGVDTRIQSTYIDYLNDVDEQVARVWLTNGRALRFRMERANLFGLTGVAFSDLMSNDIAPDILREVLDYKLQLPTVPEVRELMLRWNIEDTQGVPIGETITELNESLKVTIAAPDGDYVVNVEVVNGEIAVPRSGVAVALAEPTLTPTPLPTATATPLPTATSVPVVQNNAPPAYSGPVVAPSSGSITVGAFEYGGHVTTTGSDNAAAAMRHAGMNWMKEQIRFHQGGGTGNAADIINNARARGFKVLLAVVGSPSELGQNPEGYIQQYAAYMGQLAALGPDAIEVWNEPNIDREWPRDQISGAMYANMLRQSYQAIKSANGSVMVISGAPAPTGAEAAYPGQVVNDDNWINQMVQAGGLDYMDCLGAHYNEGITPPSAMSGDPRDNYYTRYFNGMLNTYWNLTGGRKPICFTELGYLTSDGYPPLPDYFAWAQNVTLDQHASWLAEAIALSSQSGKVRLLIVWNVDFTLYGSDPQGGYAMIRPGGGCPACDRISAAR